MIRVFEWTISLFKKRNKRNDRFKKAKEGLSVREKIAIAQFYDDCPEGYEVDHILPLSLGGLHRLDNLQYLTRSQNRSKGSKLWFKAWFKAEMIIREDDY